MSAPPRPRPPTRRALLAAPMLSPLLAAPAGRAAAQPTEAARRGRPLVLLVPFTPGAPPDLVARLLAEALARRGGQPVVVENRPGASGNIGAGAAARALPDGNTLLIHTATLVMNAAVFRELPYDPVASFAPVAMLVECEYALVLHPTGGGDLAGLLALARARPGAVNYASPGIGTPHHLCMELFRRETGTDLLHVPYRGTAGAVTALLSGEVSAMFMPVGAAAELVRDGTLRAAAVAGPVRAPLLPGVPTLAEAGVPGVAVRDWFALLAPARVPAFIVEQFNAEANAALAEPALARALAAQGYAVAGGPPEHLADRLRTDLDRWSAVVRAANITAD